MQLLRYRFPPAWFLTLLLACLLPPGGLGALLAEEGSDRGARGTDETSGAASAVSSTVPGSADLYERSIRPLMLARCVSCHGEDAQEGGLRLDTPAGLASGGRSGPAVLPGRPEGSLLFTAVRYKDTALQMPPDPAEQLTPAELQQVRDWIAAGAELPAGAAGAMKPLVAVDEAEIARGREFWSLRPLVAIQPPLSGAGWAETPIDQFIAAKHSEAGLEPAAEADRRTLIRRVWFDLIGLPPSPADLADCLSDESPAWYERLVDRLLASPQYGERWGRHWLDVARYADSNGLDENLVFGTAFRYRDYVIAALNEDRPFDQFVVEQIAGDLLPARSRQQRHELYVATGFLALGPKVLAEPDAAKLEMDLIDEQIDTIGRAVLGLTLGCARCHDHKFDPVTTADYYAIAGIFKSTRTIENFKIVARWFEHPIPDEAGQKLLDEHRSQVQRLKTIINGYLASVAEPVQLELPLGTPIPGDIEQRLSPLDTQRLTAWRQELAALEKQAPEVPTALGVTEGTVTDVAIHVRGSTESLGRMVPRGVPVVLDQGNAPAFSRSTSGRLEFARWLVSSDQGLAARVLANRIWRWHFGQGLVRTTDNFGRLGEVPSHPELLEWLASELVRSGWSWKTLHRQILLSATYRQSSRCSDLTRSLDPDNRWWSRAPLRRLEAESIRDALLASGQLLDDQQHGSLLNIKNREWVFDHTSRDRTKYDSTRRSIYLPVIRNNLYDVFQLFDYADASVINGHRESTTVAPQALFAMNSRLMQDAARGLADWSQVFARSDRITRAGLVGATAARVMPASYDSASEVARRLDAVFLAALSRRPTIEERELFGQALSDFERVDSRLPSAEYPQNSRPRIEDPWIWICQTVLSTNEFLYVR